MAAPTNPSGSTLTSGNSHTKPSGLANGDVVLIRHHWFNSSSSPATAPSGFSSAFPAVELDYGGGGYLGLGVFYKVITNAAGEPSSYTVGSAGGSVFWQGGRIDRISGADTTSPIDDAGSNSGNSGTQSTGANITTSQADALLFLACVSNGANAGNPSGMAQQYEIDGGDAEGWSETLSAQLTNATRSSSLSFSTSWVSGFVAFKPAGGGSGGAPIPVFMNHYRQMGIA